MRFALLSEPMWSNRIWLVCLEGNFNCLYNVETNLVRVTRKAANMAELYKVLPDYRLPPELLLTLLLVVWHCCCCCLLCMCGGGVGVGGDPLLSGEI